LEKCFVELVNLIEVLGLSLASRNWGQKQNLFLELSYLMDNAFVHHGWMIHQISHLENYDSSI
jgi:hypothetical protein